MFDINGETSNFQSINEKFKSDQYLSARAFGVEPPKSDRDIATNRGALSLDASYE